MRENDKGLNKDFHKKYDKKPAAKAPEGTKCPYAGKCGGCSLSGIAYDSQLHEKQRYMEKLLGTFCSVDQIVGMDDPLHYRCKLHRAFGYDRKRGTRSGIYAEGTHKIVEIENCMIEDRRSQEIIAFIKELARSFKYKAYDEDNGRGLLRHILIRRAANTGEIMVVLVLTSNIMPGKNNFVRVLTRKYPEIKTIVLNVNDSDTNMILGRSEQTIFGPGFIRDSLCGCSFRISADSFYQVNPVQAEKLYETAISFAGLSGKEMIIDAYCGTGTIGLVALKKAKSLIGIELNKDAVRDARLNAMENGLGNARFYLGDSGSCLTEMAEEGLKADVLFMDPPRTGSTEQFIEAAAAVRPSRIVYISCGPQSLARDLRSFTEHGYKVRKIQPFDMFPATSHGETVCLMSRVEGK